MSSHFQVKNLYSGWSVKLNDRTSAVVCCDDCAEKVKANPAKYAARK